MIALKIVAIISFFIAFLLSFYTFAIAMEMLDEKENKEYKISLGGKLQSRAFQAAVTWTIFVGCLLFMN